MNNWSLARPPGYRSRPSPHQGSLIRAAARPGGIPRTGRRNLARGSESSKSPRDKPYAVVLVIRRVTSASALVAWLLIVSEPTSVLSFIPSTFIFVPFRPGCAVSVRRCQLGLFLPAVSPPHSVNRAIQDEVDTTPGRPRRARATAEALLGTHLNHDCSGTASLPTPQSRRRANATGRK